MNLVKLDFGKPTEFQQRVLDAFRNGKRFVQMISGRQGGKALALDTRIPTPDGFSTMGDLQVGDYVFGIDGQPTQVTAATEVMHGHEVYAVEFTTGEIIVADADHQWYTLSKSERKHCNPGKVRTTRELAERVTVPASNGRFEYNHFVPHASPLQLPDADLPLPPYVLGVWLGDGTCGQPHVTIGSKPDIILPRMESDGFSCVKMASGEYRYRVGVQGNKYHPCALTQALMALGIYREKAIPQAYLRASEAQRRALYDGLMDTDGHVDARGHAEITFRDKALIDGMRELVASLGYKPGAITYRSEVNAYRFHWLAREVRPRAVVSVTPIDSVPVRCIEVEAPNSLFLVGEGFIPTHNSHLGARWLIGETANPDIKNKLGLVVAPTYRVARVAIRKLNEVLQEDLRLWKRIKYVSQPVPTFTFPNGWIIEVHSTDDPNALRGPTASRIWHDEPGDSSPHAFDILTPTLLAEEGKYLATGTPRGQHNWTYQKLYLPSCPPGHDDHDPDLYNPIYETVIGTTWDNVENLSEEAILALEIQYGGKDSVFARQEIYGEFVAFEGLVYTWDERTNFISRAELPKRNEFSLVVGGIDFGWVDPSCAVVAGYREGVWYVLDGVHESNMSIDELASHVAYMQATWQPQLWWADSARPESIRDLQTRGLPVRPVVKPEIEERVREMAMFADHNRLKVSYSVPFVRDELQMYQYPERDKLMRDAKRRPLDRNNHAMDALGYLIWMNRHLWRNDFRVRIHAGGEQEDDPDDVIELIQRPKVKRYRKYGPAGIVGQ